MCKFPFYLIYDRLCHHWALSSSVYIMCSKSKTNSEMKLQKIGTYSLLSEWKLQGADEYIDNEEQLCLLNLYVMYYA